MKYLKLFEADSKKNRINWEMIEDIKDMSLEYLDDGFILNIFITELEKHYDVFRYLHIEYSHEKETMKINSKFKNIIKSECGFVYGIYLKKKNCRINKGLTNEIKERIKCAYPNEIFGNTID